MRAQILSIGDELLGGYISDTNSTFLAQQLALLNIDLTLVTHVGDNRDRIAAVITRALDDGDVVICTGGVGPTEDDLTREAIAHVLGEEPEVDPGLLSIIRAFFSGRGLEMPERNHKQAWVIPSCDPLPNPVGTAPGWYIYKNRKVIAAMPGVPREMFRMWNDQLAPRLANLYSDRFARSTTLKTIGIGESAAEEKLDALVRRGDPVIATYAKDDGVHIRVTAVAETPDEAVGKRDACVSEIQSLIGSHIYGRDDVTLAGALLQALQSLGFTLSVADAGGGGRFASLLAANPGADSTLVSCEMMPVGAEGTAADLAEAIAAKATTDIGVGISVTYEPANAGTYAAAIEIAIGGQRTAARIFPIRSAYEDIQRRSALFAAEVLRSALLSD
jgi:nicotinamide-nucleotide amidase